MIPLIVYVPGNDSYISTTTFDASEDFSGKLLRKFEKNIDASDFRSFLTDWIGDTHSHQREKETRFRFVRDHHRRIVKSIFGNVIYKRVNGAIIPQAVLNIDAPVAEGVDVQNLLELRAQERLVFRIMNILLDLAVADKNLFKQIHQPIQHGG